MTAADWADFWTEADDIPTQLKASLARGLAQSAAGEIVDLGDFTRYSELLMDNVADAVITDEDDDQ